MLTPWSTTRSGAAYHVERTLDSMLPRQPASRALPPRLPGRSDFQNIPVSDTAPRPASRSPSGRTILLTGTKHAGLAEAARWLSRLGYKAQVQGARPGTITASWEQAAQPRSYRTSSPLQSDGGDSPALGVTWDQVVHLVGHPLAVASEVVDRDLATAEGVERVRAEWNFICANAKVVGCPGYRAEDGGDIPKRLLTVHEGAGNLLKSLSYWLGASGPAYAAALSAPPAAVACLTPPSNTAHARLC